MAKEVRAQVRGYRTTFFLLALFCGSLLGAQGHAATYAIAPGGADGNSGSLTQPWKTWAHALKRLVPGDTLLVKDGKYDSAQGAGFPNIDCASGYRNGTASQPITVKAEYERKAHIANNGQAASTSVNIANCSYWTLEGLYITNADYNNGSSDGGHAVHVTKSQNIILRRLLVAQPNRYRNSHAVSLNAVTNSLVEESEVYYFHRHGIYFSGHSDKNTLRRNYINSRFYADIPGGNRSAQADRGDDCFANYPATNSIMENNICEDTTTGFASISANSEVQGNRFLGNIAYNVSIGLSLTTQTPFSGTYPRDNIATDMVVIAPTNAAVWYRNGKANACHNCMVLQAKNSGFLADYYSTGTPKSDFSVEITNSLVWEHEGTGFLIKEHASWLIDYVNAYGGSTAFSPTSPNVNHTQKTDPQLGACLVWIPDNSPMKRAGKNGADIGANVLYRYENGVLTSQPLWDPSTGAFPCGAVVTGINDTAAKSCSDVHQRLQVHTSGCPLPSGYGSTGQPVLLPSPTNLRVLVSP